MSELLATALLLAVVVGSGIMAERLAGGQEAVALLANSVATAAGLIALILTFGSVSSHMNPAVTLAEAACGTTAWRRVPVYVLAQLLGAFLGVAIAHLMFELPLFAASHHDRSGWPRGLGEFVATFLLILVVLVCSRTRPAATPYAVAATVCAGYWFTSSTSFANPAVTLARAATDSFTGIRPEDVPGFLVGEALGAGAAILTFRWLFVARGP